MADERVGGVDTSIYRQQPQQDPLGMIQKLGGALDTLGELEVGKAQQSALNPQTGEIDRNEVARMLQQTIAGSRKAIPTLDALEKLRSAGYGADQAGLETFQKRMAITHHLFSGLASKTNPSMNDVYDIAAKALDPALDAKKYGITMPVIMNAIKQFRGPDGQPLSPAAIKAKALEIQTQAASTQEILNQHSPQHQMVDRGGNMELVPIGTRGNPAMGTTVSKNLGPETKVATTKGSQYLGEQPPPAPAVRVPGIDMNRTPDVTLGAPPYVNAPKNESRLMPGVNAQNTPPASIPTPVPTGPAASLRPGYEEAQKTIAASGAQAATNITNAAAAANRNKALLGNLEDDLTKFTSGRGADWSRLAKNFINRNIPVPDSWKKEGAILDEKSLASQEQFAKTAQMIAQSQFATLGGTGTDAKLDSAVSTSPNELLSQYGNKGIIRMLKGNEDAMIAQNKAWQKWKKDPKHGPDTYDEFQADFQQNFDPRVFQFQYLTPKERTDYIANMEPEIDKPKFLHNLTNARMEKWIRFDQVQGEKAAAPVPAPTRSAARPSPAPAFNPAPLPPANGGWPDPTTAPMITDDLPSWARGATRPNRSGASR